MDLLKEDWQLIVTLLIDQDKPIDKPIDTLSSMYLKITGTLASGHVFIISITYKSAQNNFGAIFFCENPKT